MLKSEAASDSRIGDTTAPGADKQALEAEIARRQQAEEALAQQVRLVAQLTRLAEQDRRSAVRQERERAAQDQAAHEQAVRSATSAAALQSEILSEIAQRQQAEQLAAGQTEALVQTVSALSLEPELDKFLGQVLTTITKQLNVFCSVLYLNDADAIEPGAEVARPYKTAFNRHLLAEERLPEHPFSSDYAPLGNSESLRQELRAAHRPILLDVDTTTLLVEEERGWLLRQEVQRLLVVPLSMGEHLLGWLNVCVVGAVPPTPG